YPICQPRLDPRQDDRSSSPPRARHLRMSDRPPGMPGTIPPNPLPTVTPVTSPNASSPSLMPQDNAHGGGASALNSGSSATARDSYPAPSANTMNHGQVRQPPTGTRHSWTSHQSAAASVPDPLPASASIEMLERNPNGYLARGTTREQLNGKYTFRNFVVGPSNELAHAAAFASAGGGGPRYNPLFICG